MYPGTYAAEAPDRIAAVMTGTGQTLSYGELERRSVQLAHVLHEAGLRPGDVVALLTENSLRAFEVYWAALRAGLYITAVNYRLKPDEVAYIVSDSGATALIVSAEQAATAEAITGLTAGVKLRLSYGGPVTGHGSYEETIAAAPAVPFADQPHGATMLYSSGTTGRPKGVQPPLPDRQVSEPGEALVTLAGQFFGVNQDSVYLSPGPIYHAAPLRWCGAIQALGGTVVMMKRFDAEQALQSIQDRRVTHAQFVPTMFVRMLQLPQQTRDRYDASSLRVAIHAAAPCPVEVKQKMIDWWGPVLVEYYAGTEGNGMTAIDSSVKCSKGVKAPVVDEAEAWVAIAFVLFLRAARLYLGAHRWVAESIDQRQARIKAELDEAVRLRQEAQAVLTEVRPAQGARGRKRGRGHHRQRQGRSRASRRRGEGKNGRFRRAPDQDGGGQDQQRRAVLEARLQFFVERLLGQIRHQHHNQRGAFDGRLGLHDVEAVL